MKSLLPDNRNRALKNVPKILLRSFGPQNWWPALSPLEIIIGCILTQNTAWTNVEKAILALKNEGLLPGQRQVLKLDPYFKKILACPQKSFASHIRSAGYFNQKSAYLLHFMNWLQTRYGGFDAFYQARARVSREELLNQKGIGPETADSILLYALKHPEFVVDAYTRRILSRHGLLEGHENYDEVKKILTQTLPKDEKLYNEYHALIVHTGKNYCKRTKPLCSLCPLNGYYQHYGPTTDKT